ncbi:hypothetical protein QUO16_002269 [Vibrio parahaemolyticus]|uniref:hypothetical protein n=1 Tax=Vibrio parahaemolyticus TaxID=670 RepID=UPI000A3D38F3|nr:hypothetical protein [Vibrio parahaemolyticus]ELA9371033.1 hypothetical protein [Vibrio parahaemolyticus]OUJ45674.1 hypothetical protein BTM22_25835 [Vibrio parahaemolyticus]HCG8704782.1 hypothetical protein [Vibrio parahaemolyticus]
MLKILFVVRGFFPDLSASGNLIYPLVKEMIELAEVDILTFSNDCKTESIDSISVTRIKNNESNLVKLFNLFKRHFSYPYYNSTLTKKIRTEVELLDKKNSYDVIIAVTHEEIIALTEANVPTEKKGCFLLEKLHETSKFSVVKQKQRQANSQIYSKICHELKFKFALPKVVDYLLMESQKNVFEIEHPMVINNIRESRVDLDEILLVYIGGLDLYQRNPWPIIDFFQSIDLNIRFDMYGYGNVFSKKSILPSKSSYKGVINKCDINERLDEASFLISIGNKENDIFPSKIFDCLSTGIPIIHFSQTLDDPYYEYLDGYDNAIIINISQLHLIEERQRIINFIIKNVGNRESYETISDKFYKQTPSYNCEKILSFING